MKAQMVIDGECVGGLIRCYGRWQQQDQQDQQDRQDRQDQHESLSFSDEEDEDDFLELAANDSSDGGVDMSGFET